ncbi:MULTISPECIES: hypothetical protein [Streptomyces]|uniref:hypothetical protein n=1 Tax=Streptomyces TaxID=1883 RepID=UPI00364974FD
MTDEKKPPYKPTRMCPHRWCRPLHSIPAPFGLAVMAFQMWHQWLYLVLIFGGMLGIVAVTGIIHNGKTPMELEAEDLKYRSTGWRVLEVRKGWANIAIACDIVLVLMIGQAVTHVVSDPSRAGQEAHDFKLGNTNFMGGCIVLAQFAFLLYAHKKATEPRKPKRAWLPAFLRTGGAG